MKRRSVRDVAWIAALLVVLAMAPLAFRFFVPRTALSAELAAQLQQGITFLFPQGPSGGTYMTFKGTTVTLQNIDGSSSDNRLVHETMEGTFTFSQGRLRMEIPNSVKPVRLDYILSEAPPGSEFRFALQSVEHESDVGFGPVTK